MPFVPGYKHDLFLSYAHLEAPWVDAFRKAVSQEFQERAGKPITFWQDQQNLRLGQKWTDEIAAGVLQTAAFLAIISPSYLNSTWCVRERRLLLDHYGGLDQLKIESFYRLLKIIKTPGPGQAHLNLLKELQPVRFFNEADQYEIPQDSKEYTALIRDTVRAIRELLTLMANRQQAFYLALAPPDMDSDRSGLQNQLSDWGYNVKPEILLSPEFGPDPVREEMEKCSLAIFLLGAVYDKFVEDQIEIARELNKRLIFWIHPAKAKAADPRQRDMLARLAKTLPAGAQFLGGASIRGMLDQFQGALQPKQEPSAPDAPQSGLAKVYLIYDSTLPAESQSAARLGDLLHKQDLEVLRSERDVHHEQFMRASDGVLLFRSIHPEPDNWLQSYLKDLRYAGAMFEKEPEAKALLVSTPERIQQDLRGIDVVPYHEPFAPERLAPFINKLRKSGAAYASR